MKNRKRDVKQQSRLRDFECPIEIVNLVLHCLGLIAHVIPYVYFRF
jgi:hypothetical protein